MIVGVSKSGKSWCFNSTVPVGFCCQHVLTVPGISVNDRRSWTSSDRIGISTVRCCDPQRTQGSDAQRVLLPPVPWLVSLRGRSPSSKTK